MEHTKNVLGKSRKTTTTTSKDERTTNDDDNVRSFEWVGELPPSLQLPIPLLPRGILFLSSSARRLSLRCLATTTHQAAAPSSFVKKIFFSKWRRNRSRQNYYNFMEMWSDIIISRRRCWRLGGRWIKIHGFHQRNDNRTLTDCSISLLLFFCSTNHHPHQQQQHHRNNHESRKYPSSSPCLAFIFMPPNLLL